MPKLNHISSNHQQGMGKEMFKTIKPFFDWSYFPICCMSLVLLEVNGILVSSENKVLNKSQLRIEGKDDHFKLC